MFVIDPTDSTSWRTTRCRRSSAPTSVTWCSCSSPSASTTSSGLISWTPPRRRRSSGRWSNCTRWGRSTTAASSPSWGAGAQSVTKCDRVWPKVTKSDQLPTPLLFTNFWT
eukprot:208095-Prorocentrum_minimum.AAC.3